MIIDRRTLLAGAAASPLLFCDSRASAAARRPTASEQAAMQRLGNAFMQKYAVPGLQVAIAADGEMVHEAAYGLADTSGEALTPAHRFRIASISKTITSTAIFTLIERGPLRLSDRVFGAGGLLRNDYPKSPQSQWIDDITVEHLLTHTSGGWTNDGNDPMFRRPELNHADLIRWTLQSQPQLHPPGTVYAYSNFGFCLLGRVIEQVAQKPYADYVQEAVLKPAGVEDMTIANNRPDQRQPNEVRYYAPGGIDPYRPNVHRMDSHGGWIASATALVKFANHVTDLKPPPLLKPASLREMLTPSKINKGYARGWAVNDAGNCWHNGSLDGTTTIMVRTKSRFSWAALTNASARGDNIGGDLDDLVWKMTGAVASWRA
jgi:CubicO group peptidase (beta-lactamase class C family)